MDDGGDYSIFNETDSIQDDVDVVNSVTDFSSSSSTDQLGDSDEDRSSASSASLLSTEFMGSVAAMVVLDLVIVIGNAMVIAAVFTHSKLRCTTTNKFVVSLAVADLMVGMIVLPFSSANQVLHYWPFGVVWCRAWLAIDVWLCTASIFNLCAISLDRYLAISRPIKYPTVMSPLRARLLIITVWILSFVICFPPLIGNWNDVHPVKQKQLQQRHHPSPIRMTAFRDVIDDVISLGDVSDGVVSPNDNGSGYSHVGKFPDAGKYLTYESEVDYDGDVGLPNCALTSDPGYIIYSACGSFWVPMLGMVVFYGKIYKTAVAATQAMKRGFIEKRTTGSSGLSNSASDNALCTLRIHRGGSTTSGSMVRHSNGCISELLPRPSTDILLLQRTGSASGRRSCDGRLMSMKSAERQQCARPAAELRGRANRTTPAVQPLPVIVITASVSCNDDVASGPKKSDENVEPQQQQQQQQQTTTTTTPQNESESTNIDRVSNKDGGVNPKPKSFRFGFRNKRKKKAARAARDGGTLAAESEANDDATVLSSVGFNRSNGSKRKNSCLGLIDADGNANGDSVTGNGGGKRTSIQLVAARFAKLHIISQLRNLNKEKRAAKTVGIIVGCFVICWAPFFTVYLAEAFCSQCTPTSVFHVFFWLGYCNSALNPFIYGLCSRDFRYAFKKFLRCGCFVGNWRSSGGGLVHQTNGQVMGLLQSMTMQIVARAAAGAASATVT